MPSETAAKLLENWLKRGYMRSRVEEYAQSLRSSDDSFYTSTLDHKGKDAAEAHLAEMIAKRHMHEFANAIEPAVRGLLALAKIEDKGLIRILDPSISLESDYNFAFTEATLVFKNEMAPGCSCMQPQGSNIFGRWGSDLELIAVTLRVGTHRDGYPVAKLGLVMPCRQVVRYGKNAREAYTILTFDLKGDNGGSQYTLEDDHLVHFAHLIGEQSDRNMMVGTMTGGSISTRVGFPGASDYFAKYLKDLGPFLEGLAKHLDPDHLLQH